MSLHATMNISSTIQTASQSPNLPFSEGLATLRTQWKWAAFSQFFYTFSALLPLDDVSLIDIESDLVEGTSHVIPRLMTRLLYTLTYDRKVSLENWQFILHKQYMRRASHLNPFTLSSQNDVHDNNRVAQKPPVDRSSSEKCEEAGGHDAFTSTSNEFNDWDRLSMLQKLDSIHLLAEWQFQNPSRLRALMKCDDEYASWRIEPIGYDKQKNSYWLIGPDRLWIQYAPSRNLSKKCSTKRTKQNTMTHTRKVTLRGSKRRRVDENSNFDGSKNPICYSDTNQRSAKTQAKLDLDIHTQATLDCYPSHRRRRQVVHNSTYSIGSRGTRVSSRLRGTQQEGRQPLPQEWKEESDEQHLHSSYSSFSILKTGLETESDEMSELTELSDDNDRISLPPGPTFNYEDKLPNKLLLCDAPEEEPLEFVEWETICVSLYDWEHIADRFASGTHYSEKALHKYLIHHLVPSVTERLKAIERKKRLEEAIIYRKRSSRIATKESRRAEASAAARNLTQEKEKMSRSKRLEARQQREERRIQQDNSRQLRREKEQRGRQKANEEAFKNPSNYEPNRVGFTSTDTNPQARRDLDCEMRPLHDGNLDQCGPLIPCSLCLKLQQMSCSTQVRATPAGLMHREWDGTDSVCQGCRTKAHPNDEIGWNNSLRTLAPYIHPHSENRHRLNHNLPGNSTYYETSAIGTQATEATSYSSLLIRLPSMNNKLPHCSTVDYL